MTLKDKVILLTGGASGIGWECAKAYAAEGAWVAIASLGVEAVQQAADRLGKGHMGICCDVTRPDQVHATIEAVLARYGGIDAVHNNAGIGAPSKTLHETTAEEWDRVFETNLKAVLYTTQCAFEALKASSGCILNTSSMVGEIGQEAHAAYSATKGGMNALTKSMAADYARYSIRVNAVCPAGVWTPMLREWCAEQPDPASIEQYLDQIHLLNYCPGGDVVADACVFLLSDKARFITGHILNVSGGAELGYRRPSA
jgi:meso-butanediol dehydrogenase/(S,S)-butanediol dehydrogenase/diacetyl reductase